MNTRIIILTFLATLITACAMPVYDDEIDWRHPNLNRDGCPDLSGLYFDDGAPRQEMMRCPVSWSCSRVEGLFPLMIGKLQKLPEYRFEKYMPFPKPILKKAGPIYVTAVRHTPSEIELRLQDTQGKEYSSLSMPLRHERIGCHNGTLIVRSVGNLIGSEGGSGSVQYSETEIQKNMDGSLVLTEWRAWHYRSKLSGKAYGEAQDVAQRSWYFFPAH